MKHVQVFFAAASLRWAVFGPPTLVGLICACITVSIVLIDVIVSFRRWHRQQIDLDRGLRRIAAQLRQGNDDGMSDV